MNKAKIRHIMTSLRGSYPPRLQKKHGNRVSKLLISLFEDLDVQTIHSFIPLPKEIDILPALQTALAQYRKVVVPQTLKNRQLKHWVLTDIDQLVPGNFSTLHPKNGIEHLGSYDLIIVPGLAFDKENNRLGYGAGYYDTFLSHHLATLKVGVGFPFQLLDRIPTEPHDVKLDKIIC